MWEIIFILAILLFSYKIYQLIDRHNHWVKRHIHLAEEFKSLAEHYKAHLREHHNEDA